MRLIYSTEDKKLSYQFSEFLKKEGIENLFEIVTKTDWGSSEYGTHKCYVWIVDEEQVEKAQEWLNLYKQDPHLPIFHVEDRKILGTTPPLTPAEEPQKNKQALDNKRMGKVTLYILVACVLLFLAGQLTTPQVEYSTVDLPSTPLYSPPINKLLYYDYPQAYEIIDKLVRIYGIEKLQNLDSLPAEGLLLIEKYIRTPVWTGLYDKFVEYLSTHTDQGFFTEPMFEKIKQGEIWRVFTPCLLHANFFHIFFNMLWLVFLGKLIEDRIGAFRYILLIVITAVFSNTAQYLMSGSNFVGYSGVICGMLAFIWSRQRTAPWESYNLTPSIISFMLFFVMAMLGLQIASFFLKVYEGLEYFPSIANTAHIVGGLAGFILGRFNFMSMKS